MSPEKDVLEIQQKGNVCVIKFKLKEINLDENGLFYDKLKELVDSGKTAILIDFTGVAYISSLVIGTLMSGLKNTRAKGGTMKLCCLSEKIRQALEITQLTKILEIYQSQEEALQKGNWGKKEGNIEYK